MTRYIASRIGQALFVLWVAFTAAFLLLQALPGDAILIRFQSPDLGLSPDQLQRRITIEKLYVPVKQSNVEIIEGDTAEEQAANLAKKLRDARLI